MALRYTKSVDLTPYNCVPQHIQFSSLCKQQLNINGRFKLNKINIGLNFIDGMVIVECFEPVTNRGIDLTYRFFNHYFSKFLRNHKRRFFAFANSNNTYLIFTNF